ncbi:MULTISPECIES: glycosyltransferase family 4 protein [Klebsiella]|uniref:glycosyltransferase family 4 protein n=1 Tax=Klebsiella TaxID=570 RepID=UPI0022977567|nr:glycosyltransferase family 4 protein [Klebsiella sp. 141203]ELA2273240.1 glycosyltransferase family 4 protein [Klebsiella aerogenes]MDU9363940.1 glycosyltransferase family 4 protein [Klebsiella sp. 141203]HBW5536647.1 glycosyltransferase family 4 protein [Klebsiella aerogenes]HCS4221568.1 glycosyltransferase family 4 protein [Klebsiella aerogenes]HCT4435992.1 glycosyltransferase family 4 protein [Klebsiella aerogenes]
MINKFKTAVVFTASIVGGHELMTIAHIKRFLNKGIDLSCFVPDDNSQLKKILANQGVEYNTHAICHKRLEILHSFFNLKYRTLARNFLKKISTDYDYIIIVQGDIELGSVFLNEGVRVCREQIISYIPYTHSFSLMGSKLSLIKDILSRSVYKKCDKYISISNIFASELTKRNPNAAVRVLRNVIVNFNPENIRGSGYTYRPKENEFVLLMAGRVYFRQKGQHLLVGALKKINVKKNIRVKVIGDGPDLNKMKEMSDALSSNVTFEYMGWKNNIWDHTKDVDALVLPSLYEGVPLVMLEAIKANVSIIAPARDGMRDYIPQGYLYKTGSEEEEIEALSQKLKEIISSN